MSNMQTITILMRKCFSCGLEKPLSDFHKDKNRKLGHAYICKDCDKEYHRKYNQTNKERINAKARKYYREKREQERARLNKYRQDNPEKRRAMDTLNNAIRSGEVIRPNTCSKPDCNNKPAGHHEDYSKPLDVEWLCKACHQQLHEKRKRLKKD